MQMMRRGRMQEYPDEKEQEGEMGPTIRHPRPHWGLSWSHTHNVSTPLALEMAMLTDEDPRGSAGLNVTNFGRA